MIAMHQFAKRLSRATRSSFVRAVATLSTGQLFATIIPLLAAPLLGRLYAPSDYGILAIVLALTAIFGGGASTFALHLAIIIERRERNAEAIVFASILASCLMAAVGLVAAILSFQALPKDADTAAYAPWLFLLPATIVGAGTTAAVGALANRRARYGPMARYRVIQALATTALSIGFGFAGWGAHGLFIGYFVGQAIYVTSNALLFFRLREWPRWPSFGRVVVLIRRHKRFPFLVVPSDLIGQFRLQLASLALTALGNVALLGNYSRSRQLISMPLQLLGSSIGQVFRQRAALDLRTTGSCRAIWLRTFGVLTLVGLPMTLFFMAIAPFLITFVLGPRWTVAGQMAQIVAPMLFASFVCAPLSSVFYIFGAQREEFMLSILGTGVTFASVLCAALLDRSGHAVVWAYSASNVAVYAVYLMRSWTLVSRGAPASP